MKIFSKLKKTLILFLRRFVSLGHGNIESLILLQVQIISENHRRLTTLKGLYEAEFCAFSQWGEDGIIDWLINSIPDIPRTFIEFGVENYRESNTRLLLMMRNWRGLILDGSENNVSDIKRQGVYWRHDITARCAFIDRENINDLITSSGLLGQIGVLSIDIDGNDYWVWERINVVSPAIVVVEYNAVLGDMNQCSTPYQADFVRTTAHYSNLYFGASLPALISLGEKKGYQFVGTNSSGCNAFFVREDLAFNVIARLDNIYAFPSRFREARGRNGHLTFPDNNHRSLMIDDLDLTDTSSGDIVKLKEYKVIYSLEWSKGDPRRVAIARDKL